MNKIGNSGKGKKNGVRKIWKQKNWEQWNGK